MNEYIYSSLNELEKILSSNPDDKFAWKESGALRLEQNDKSGAINDFQKALEIDSTFTEARANIGLVKMMQGKYIEAIEHFDKALSIDNNKDGLYYSRASAKIKTGDTVGVIEDCKKELSNNSKAINCYRLMGLAERSLENYKEALKDFLVYIRYQLNKSPKDYYYVGECYYELKEYSKAKEFFEKAFDLLKNNSEIGLKEHMGAIVYEARKDYGDFGKLTFSELGENIVSYMNRFTFGSYNVQDKILDEPSIINEKPNYIVTNDNIQILLDHYFPLSPRDDINQLTVKIKKSKIDLKELEVCAFEISIINQVFWKNKLELDREPTQSNLLQYAIESFIKVNWDNAEKDEERLKIIERIRNEVGKRKSYKDDYLYTTNFDYVDLEEPGWSESPDYDEDLDWDQQSAEFYDDVL